MARIPYYDLSKASPVVADAMKDRRPLNIYRMIAHGEQTAVSFLALGRSILTMSEIDAKLRELVILRVGALCGSTYEVLQHRRVASKAGVSAEKIEAVLADPGRECTRIFSMTWSKLFFGSLIRSFATSRRLNLFSEK